MMYSPSIYLSEACSDINVTMHHHLRAVVWFDCHVHSQDGKALLLVGRDCILKITHSMYTTLSSLVIQLKTFAMMQYTMTEGTVHSNHPLPTHPSKKKALNLAVCICFYGV